MTDSSTGGILTPNTPYPADDDALDAILQALVTGITGLDPTAVRPRWQPNVPKVLNPSGNWCAIGVMSSTPDDGPWIGYDPANNVGPYVRHEQLEVVATFYGPLAKTNAAILRDGLAVPQNTESLRAQDMAYVSTGAIHTAPELVNQQWVRRQDMGITLRRKVSRTYQIHNIAIAAVHLIDDTVVNDTIIVPPGSPTVP